MNPTNQFWMLVNGQPPSPMLLTTHAEGWATRHRPVHIVGERKTLCGLRSGLWEWTGEPRSDYPMCKSCVKLAGLARMEASTKP